MAARVQLFGFEDEQPVVQATFFLKDDGTVGIEAPRPTGVGYAARLVAGGIEGRDGKKYHLSDGQAFLDNLKYHFRSRYTWVRDEKPQP
jgi:hypothetical protein